MRYLLCYLTILAIPFKYTVAQKDGLLKNEKITTYWDNDEKQVRSIGFYQTSGYSNIGAKTGKWIHFYKNGKTQEISNYYKGELNGIYKSYYLNGNLNIKTFYVLGKIDSIFEAYYENGLLAEKGSYLINPEISFNDTSSLDYWIKKNEKIRSSKCNRWEYFYEQGELMEKSHFNKNDSTELIDFFYDQSGEVLINNGKGVRKTYYPSNKIKSIVEYSNGQKNGLYQLFKPNGEIRKTGKYKNGKITGNWVELFITSDSIYQKTEYKNGMKNGMFQEFYSNGNINMDGEYIDDLKNGIWNYYFVNGSSDMNGGFLNNQQDGFWTFYYPKGLEYYKGEFSNGQKTGNWEFFYNDGAIWKKGEFKFDQKNGFWRTKFENGMIAMEGNYSMNKEDGLWKSWYGNGQLKDEGSFNLGKMNNSWVGYYTNGQKKYSGEYEDDYKMNLWTYWSEKGNIIETRNYILETSKSNLVKNDVRVIKKSVADGKWIKYSEYDQSIKSEENYAEGKLHGRCTYFYPGGIIANRIVNYKNGLMEGNYQNFNRKGGLISETNYKKNRKNGDVKIYSKPGKLISHFIYKDGLRIKDEIKKINFQYNSPTQKK